MNAIIAGKVEDVNNGTVFSPLVVYEDIYYNKFQEFSIPSENANAVLIRYKTQYKQIEIESFIQLDKAYTIAVGYRHDIGDYSVTITQVTINFEYNNTLGSRISLNSSYYLQNFIASIEIGTLE